MADAHVDLAALTDLVALLRRALNDRFTSSNAPLPVSILSHDQNRGELKSSMPRQTKPARGWGSARRRSRAHDAATARAVLDPGSLATLAADLKTVWAAPSTDARLKKRIVRTVIHRPAHAQDPARDFRASSRACEQSATALRYAIGDRKLGERMAFNCCLLAPL